jgi:hypothetical protein
VKKLCNEGEFVRDFKNCANQVFMGPDLVPGLGSGVVAQKIIGFVPG